ncbi:MAG: imidazole glycerol phosphate synthase subunit HisH [Gammaproteobacteria bacterium]|nr:imidazole glycerol phosphate synthase subunit HisH [Gammaproteobacteria bacterium]MDE0444050.1 imidazole glycerol phosphate synthase subunit HisH [Gammaproteobacteria bacterium]
MVVIVDYDAGNLKSVERACREVGLSAEISSHPNRIRTAERVIFPGVGAAGSAMRSLAASGAGRALVAAFETGTPILGICLGLQISLEYSEENDTDTLGLLPGEVRRFRLDDPNLKVPHMGWNAVRVIRPHPVLDGIQPGDEFYFVHAYRPIPGKRTDVIAESVYEGPFCSALGRGNYVATQFHPEKSGRVGLRLLERFAEWDGRVDA